MMATLTLMLFCVAVSVTAASYEAATDRVRGPIYRQMRASFYRDTPHMHDGCRWRAF